ncbi:iron chaperone [Paenibacillus sacheonensis]|uniref:YdhG-like domain-containing protein n=1 Tax=Paenibacillus sacheonensis TaxID=742054 RepID=A0A7X4YTV7_9BACL|nr:DUF1801 domain-containing protein [Paenibacillus sacheonensis]MBM7568613.1 uncharacterized protein YdhG (YjbR/CyaY superfamily) [Paenibacillus sacheonensis]NBC72492.1 hypothetical protein [Paenibacillus sacheonensis]
MPDNKTAPDSTDDYIAAFPPNVQETLQALRQTIKEAAPEAKEKIAYQMPAFDLHGSLVYFAAYKNHIGFYPTASGIRDFQDELSAYKTSKGAIQFPLGEALPFALIKRIVEYRAAENIEKASRKREKKR